MIFDDHPVADVACSSTVWGDGSLRATEPLVESFLDRMTFRPVIVDFAALAMVSYVLFPTTKDIISEWVDGNPVIPLDEAINHMLEYQMVYELALEMIADECNRGIDAYHIAPASMHESWRTRSQLTTAIDDALDQLSIPEVSNHFYRLL